MANDRGLAGRCRFDAGRDENPPGSDAHGGHRNIDSVPAIGGVRACRHGGAVKTATESDLAEKQFVQIPEMIRIANGASQRECIWLGSGFHWTDIEASRMHSLIGRGIAAQMGKELLHKDGAYWLHGLAKESDIYADLGNLVGHTLIVGTTRVGKTRILDLLIAQAIVRGEPVIIIDPEGRSRAWQRMREKSVMALGQGERFIYFHPAHPEKSACIDPLRNWNRKTELASRIAALIPSETGADPFTAFGWKVLNDIVNGLIATGIRPNLVQLRRYIEGGPDDLLLKALRLHFKHHVQDWEVAGQQLHQAIPGQSAAGLHQFLQGNRHP